MPVPKLCAVVMGVFYNSFCLRGDCRKDVRGSLQRWLHGRGFALSGQPMLFDLDGEVERSAFLASNGRWTVLVFSHYEEEGRLLRELRTWAAPLVYVWVQDSDVWGYDLADGGGFAASFSSDPRAYRSLPDEAGDRPTADAETVHRLLTDAGGPRIGDAAELQRIHRRRKIFAEDVCREFCLWLGAEAAAVSYDDLERGAATTLDGWYTEQLLFYHPDAVAPPAVGTNLHAVDLRELGRTFSANPSHSGLTPALKAELEVLRRRVYLRLLFLRPLSWLAHGWRSSRERLSPRPSVRPPAAPEAPRHAASGSGDVCRNARHFCQIALAPGVRSRPVSGRPAAVFAFDVGGTPVTCTARRRWKIDDVLRPPSRSEVLRDEKYRTESGLAARHVLFKLPPRYLAESHDPSYLGLHVVETGVALYVFLYRFLREFRANVDQAVRLTAASFELLEGAETLWSPGTDEA